MMREIPRIPKLKCTLVIAKSWYFVAVSQYTFTLCNLLNYPTYLILEI